MHIELTIPLAFHGLHEDFSSSEGDVVGGLPNLDTFEASSLEIFRELHTFVII